MTRNNEIITNPYKYVLPSQKDWEEFNIYEEKIRIKKLLALSESV